MGKQVVLHPFLFAAYPVFFFFAHNIDELLLRDMASPLFATLVITAGVWIALKPLVPDGARRGLLLSAAFFFFFTYGHFYNALEGFRVLGMEVGRHRYLFPLWTVLLFASVYGVLRAPAQLAAATRPLNVLAGVLVLYSAGNIAFAGINRSRASVPESTPLLDDLATTAVDGTAMTRDIYYIILDRYGSARTLQDQYGFDNSEFLDYLTKVGFFVAEKSNANYPKTTQSLASSLNLSYLDEIAMAQGQSSEDATPLHEMLQNHALWRFLKSRGYRYLHFGSSWPPTRKNRYADANVNSSSRSQVFMVLYETTLLYPITSKFGILPEHLDHRIIQRGRVLHKFEQLENVPNTDGPVFAFVHMLLPHDPYVFDRDGRFVTAHEASVRSKKENYIAQLEFTNRKLRELVGSLLAGYDEKPIIILQGDEGPFPERYVLEGGEWWEHATRRELAQKMGILNAYYLPDGGSELLYPSITPVNSFRVVLNSYFGTELPLLPDRSYAIADDTHVYSFFEVTDSLRAETGLPAQRD